MSIQIIGYMITGRDYGIDFTVTQWVVHRQIHYFVLIAGCTLMAVPLSALSELARCYSSDESLTTLLRPTHQWGPHHYQEDVL